MARYGRLDLLCLDELGYVQLDARGSELLFQILTEREEKASVALASNLPFSEWGRVIPDPRLVAAIVDRVTFNAHILETGTDSYRLRTTRTRTRRKTALNDPFPRHPPPITARPRASTGHTRDGFRPAGENSQVGPDQMSTVGPIRLDTLTERGVAAESLAQRATLHCALWWRWVAALDGGGDVTYD